MADNNLIHVKTESGFECDVNTRHLSDMRMLDDLVELDKGNAAVYPRVITRLLPPEDKERLYAHIQDEDGVVPIDRFGAELMQIFAAVGEHQKAKK